MNAIANSTPIQVIYLGNCSHMFPHSLYTISSSPVHLSSYGCKVKGRVTRFVRNFATLAKSRGLCNFSGINLVFGNICDLFWQFLYAIELIFINGNGQILKNTLDIWSHWSKALMLINTFRNSHNLKTPNGQEKVIFIESALLLPFQNFFGLIFILECNYMSCPV